MNLPKLLVLLGPTAVGKTQLSLQIAKKYQCEIISGDSMQVYRRMDIGTAKIHPDDMLGIPHYMIDIVEPTESFSAAQFQVMTEQFIRDIDLRQNLPFIVGGTGLYIESLCYRYHFSQAASDSVFRESMESFARVNGAEGLHQKLLLVDPDTAERLHPNDQRRVIRALEVHHVTGQTMSALLATQQKEPNYQLCLIGLKRDRQQLYERIEGRVDEMIQLGLVEEVQSLLESGCTLQHLSMQALGYKEIAGYLKGDMSLEDAIVLLKKRTRNYAKRQMSWFRHMKDIHWLDLSEKTNFDEQFDYISDIINMTFTSA
jgi:tRNA dimethylallyltransferase